MKLVGKCTAQELGSGAIHHHHLDHTYVMEMNGHAGYPEVQSPHHLPVKEAVQQRIKGGS